MDWQELCKKAANELDPSKLMQLIAELTKALDERNHKRSTSLDRGDDKDPGDHRLSPFILTSRTIIARSRRWASLAIESCPLPA